VAAEAPHLLTSAEDCTLDLTAPPPAPEQWRRSKVVPRDHIELVIERLRADEQKRQAKHEERAEVRQTKRGALRLVGSAKKEEPHDTPAKCRHRSRK
jgi:hypothetical protein